MSRSGSVPMATNSGHSGPPILAEPAQPITSGVHNKWSDLDLLDTGNSNSGHVCHSPQHASSPVYVSNLGASSTCHRWQGRPIFMFPPFPLPFIVIQKLRTTQEGEVILIAPWWPHNLGVHIYYVFVWAPLNFPYCRDLLSQQGYVSDGKSYHLCAWRLSCSTTKLPHLLCLSVDHPFNFPYCRDLLSQQGYVSDGKLYRLCAWRLSCSTIMQQDCRRGL